MKISDKVTIEQIVEAIERDNYTGICVACGFEQDGCEPDARRYKCENCNKNAVFGASELLFYVAQEVYMSIFRCEYHQRNEDSDFIHMIELCDFYHEYPGIEKLFIKNGYTNKYEVYCEEGLFEWVQNMLDTSDLTDKELGHYIQIMEWD